MSPAVRLRDWFRRRTLRERLIVAMALGALIVLMLRQWEVSQVRDLERAHRETQAAHVEARIALRRLQDYYTNGLALRWSRRVSEGQLRQPQALADLRAARPDAEADWWFLEQITPRMAPGIRQAFAAAVDQRAAADAAALRLERILQPDAGAALPAFVLGELEPAVAPLDRALDAVAGALRAHEFESLREMTSQSERQQLTINLLRAATLAGVIILVILLFRGLDRDIGRLVAHAHRLSARDFVTPLAEPPSGELRELGRAFTALQDALADYQRQLERSERLFQLSPDLLCIAGTDGFFRHLNPAFEKVLGYSLDELRARPFTDFVHPDDVAATAAETAKLARGEPTINFQNRYRRRDGSYVWLAWRCQPAAGELFAVARDVTEHRRLEQELQEREIEAHAANQAKSAFLATMSHEIRTPLVGVLGMLDVLGTTRLDGEQRRQFNIVQHSARTLLEIIGDILDYSKIEAGKVELVPETFSVRDLVSTVASMFSANAESKGLFLVQEVAPDIAPAHVSDPLRIRQVLANFVSNAVKFTERGSVTLAVHVAEGGARAQDLIFQVADTGIGIPEDQMPRLFQPFTQSDHGTRRRYGGTGLGLVICRRLANLLGGTVRAKSAPGKGTTMTLELRLPVGDPAALAPAEPAREEQVRTRCKPDRAQAAREGSLLLMAEDHPVNRKVLATQFDLAGFVVDTAEDGVRALEKYATGAYGLVFTDLHMPGLDGYQLAAAIRELEARDGRARTPIIALTANVLRADVERCYEFGMDDYMAKPVTIRQLTEKLRRWLPDLSWEAVPPAPSGGQNPAIDAAVLSQVCGDDAARTRGFLRDYCRAAAGDLLALQAAAPGDGTARVAHRVRGAALMIGAREVAEIAGRIEQRARGSEGAGLPELHEQLRQAVARVDAYVRGLPEIPA